MAATYPEAPTGRSCGAAGPPERGPRSVHSRPRRTCLHSRGGRRLPVGVGERHREPMSRRTPHRMTARSPEDLFALAPIALGFHPEESLVMLTFGRTAFHARIDLPEGPEDRELVRSMIDLIHRFGKKCVAEGVETIKQYAELADLGCDLAQGYLLSRPVSIAEAHELWRRRQLILPPGTVRA